MNELIINPEKSIIAQGHIIYVMRFTFKSDISVNDFCDKAQDILYDDMGSSGHFRVAPKNKADLNRDFVVGCNAGAQIKDYYQQNNNELIVAFCISEDSEFTMNEELGANATELSLFCEQVKASIEQVDIRVMY